MAVTAAQQRAYSSRMEALVKGAVRAEATATAQASKLLSEALVEITDQLRRTPESQWTFGQLQTIRAEIAKTAEQMGAKLTAQARRSLKEFADLGSVSVLEPLAAEGIVTAETIAALPAIDPVLVNVLTGFSADLISDVARGVVEQMSRQVSLGILQGKGPGQVADGIEAILRRTKGSALGFGTLEMRAEAIARTESLRAFSLTQQARGNQLAKIVPGLKKRWLTTLDGRERETHRRAHRQLVDNKKRFVLGPPVKGKGGQARLNMPRDPGGLGSPKDVARETIMCRCALLYEVPQGATPKRLSPDAARAEVTTIERDTRQFIDELS